MKYCNSNEKYLRPTLYCNSHSPEVIALANKLGAYNKSDKDFAKAAFDFAKRKKFIMQIDACIYVENRKSIALVDKLGFKMTDTKFEIFRGEKYLHNIYSLSI